MCFVDQFTEDKVADAQRIATSHLVTVIEDPAITARGKAFRHMVRVQVRLTDGTTMQETVEAPRGSEHSFAEPDVVIEKFRKLASRRLPVERVERIIDSVMHAENLASAAEIAGALAR